MNDYSNRPGSGGYGRQQAHGRSQQGKTITLPDFNDPELLGTKAQKLAEDLAKDRDLTSSQLRTFYGEVKNIERLLDAAPESEKKKKWEEVYPRIKLIRAKAVYNANRKQGKIPDEYKQFLEKGIDKIGHEFTEGFKNFKTFCMLFEAVVGYASEYAKEGK